MVAAICPQLRGQDQCCSDDYFNNARKKLKDQDLKYGFGMQAQPKVSNFSSLANGIISCKPTPKIIIHTKGVVSWIVP